MRLVSALIVAAAVGLLASFSADAHLSAAPSFLAAGGKARLLLTVHNDRTEVMTGFALTVPDGFRILGTGGATGWDEAVDGATARWTGGSLAANRPVAFEVDLEAPGEPGAVELHGAQLYPGGEVVSWPVTVTVTPAGESSSSGRFEPALVVAAVGVVVAAALLIFVLRRRGSLQEK